MSEDEPPQTPEIEEEIEEPQVTEQVIEKENDSAEDLEISSLKNKVSQLESEISSKDEKIVMLDEELNSIKDQLKELKDAETASKETIKDLEHRLSQKELENTRLEGSVEDLSIAKKKIEDLQKEQKKLEEELRALQKITHNDPKFIIINDLKEFGEMRLNQISMKAGVSPAQAKKWLDELEQAGLIEIHGEGRDSNPLVSMKKK